MAYNSYSTSLNSLNLCTYIYVSMHVSQEFIGDIHLLTYVVRTYVTGSGKIDHVHTRTEIPFID